MNDSLYDQFVRTERKYPHNIALRFEHRTYSYERLDQRILDCARRLAYLGVKKGDVVSVSLPNCPISVHLFYAINLLGAISYNIHPLTKPKKISEMMKQADSHLLFSLSLNAKELNDGLASDIRFILVNPYYKENIIKYLAVKKKSGNQGRGTPYEKLKMTKQVEVLHPRKDEDSVYLNTGGTNGDPKIVRLSNESINYLAKQGYPLIGGNVKDIRILTAIPLFHGFGLGMGVHTPLSAGASSVLMLKFNTKEAIRYIRKGQATVLIGVPALYNALLSRERFYGPFLKKQIIAYIGGDNVPKELLKRWNRTMEEYHSNARLYEGYGLTETVTCCSVNTKDGRSREGSIGKGLPGIDILIRNPDTDEILPHMVDGEILVSGPTLMNGYLNQKDEKDLFVWIKGKKYLSTKDWGYLDKDGYLYFRQRMRRIVKINGESLCPSDVENIVLKNQDVYEAYCYGAKDEKRGHCFRLAISKNQNSIKDNETLKKEILEAIRKELPPSYLPDRIDVYQKLPHTPVGKIDTSKFKEDDKKQSLS